MDRAGATDPGSGVKWPVILGLCCNFSELLSRVAVDLLLFKAVA